MPLDVGFRSVEEHFVPRAKLDELEGYLTTSAVSRTLGLSPYLIKARIADGALPPPSRVSDAGVLMFDEAWMAAAREALDAAPLRQRRPRHSGRAMLPSPESVLGHTMGDAGWLPDWAEIVHYFHVLAGASDRVEVEVLGESTSGRPYIVVAISAPENLTPAARARERELLDQLWDPRGLDDAELEQIVQEARSVGIILATQHANEIGAALMTLELAHDLASGRDADTQELLANTLTLLVPSHNPDGVQTIADWYRRWRGTEYDGSDLPWLYHPYVGHDNNRDWFMLTQAETRNYVALHNREHPQAVFDMHQMGRLGPRFMVPPFIDPLDPNQDPLIQQGFAALGTHIAQRLTAANKAGVVTQAIFDNYSPSLAYGNYHGSVDLLSEAASAKLATPVTLKEDELKEEHGEFDPKQRRWNQPQPWKGGEWSLREIVEYDKIAARAFLDHLARNRAQWLRDYATINARSATRTEKPYAFVFPPAQRDPWTASELLATLHDGLVDVEEATAPFVAGGVTWPAGSALVRLDQPAGTFAKTLLEVQAYPDLRKWPGGPPAPPYDIAGHTLPIQMGVRAVAVEQPLAEDLPTRILDEISSPSGSVSGTGEAGYGFDATTNQWARAVNALLTRDTPVYRITEAARGLQPGAVIVPDGPEMRDRLSRLAAETGIEMRALEAGEPLNGLRQGRTRLGVYQPWTACIDEGWARWVLEQYGYPYETLHNADIRQGGLRERFDAVLIPEMTAAELTDGRGEKGRYGDPYPPEYTGGLGELGLDELKAFTRAGGTLIVIDRATAAFIEHFALPVRLPLRGVSESDFYCPGSLLRVVMDSTHPLGWGLARETAVLFMHSLVFEATDPSATVVARYPHADPNLSGWILGAEKIEGKGALVDVAFGEGRVVLVGFRPYFRAQTRGTYRVLFNAIARAGCEEAQIPLE